MGFDNECILNIQSLAGEYFCPVCRLLVYPNEALQSQCTHLYCKPCLAYVVKTTQACPYDGYLVTEADSKPLSESNKALAETIGKISVHCLYHRSGCTWQGSLSDCISHCFECAFGNSPVVCNRCAIQIVHRQVQEHAQNCPGVQAQAQQVVGAAETSAAGTASTTDQPQTATQVAVVTSQVQPSQTTAATAPGKDLNQQSISSSQTQAVVPTTEQWYHQQQQYQQYYQQYPGYDLYQQQYQQFYPYQQAAAPQYQQQYAQAQAPHSSVQNQSQAYMQPQPQPQPLAAVATQPQNQPQIMLPQQGQHAVLPQSQTQPQTYPLAHGNPQPQPYSQNQLHPHPHSQHVQMPQYMQPPSQLQSKQQTQSQVQPLYHPPSQPHLLSQSQQPGQLQHNLQQNQPLNTNLQSQTQLASTHAVTSHQSYLQPNIDPQVQSGTSQQYAVHGQSQNPAQMQSQYPQQLPVMRPLLSHATIPGQQQPALVPSPGQVQNIPSAEQQLIQSHFQQPGQPVHQRPVVQPAQPTFSQQHYQQQLPMSSQLRPQGQSHLFPTQSYPYSQLSQNVALSHGMQHAKPSNSVVRPSMPNQGVQSQLYSQHAGGLVRPVYPGVNQQSASHNSMLIANNQMQPPSEQHSAMNSKLTMAEKKVDHTSDKGTTQNEAEVSLQVSVEIGGNDTAARVSEMAIEKPETDIKSLDANQVGTTSKEFSESTKLLESENGEPKSKPIMKEGSLENTTGHLNKGDQSEVVAEDTKDGNKVGPGKLNHSIVEDKMTVDGSPNKPSNLQGESTQNVTLSRPQVGVDENRQSSQVLPGGFVEPSHSFPDQGKHQLLPSHFGPSIPQRPGGPSLLQVPPGLGPPQTYFRPQRPRHAPELRPPSSIRGPHLSNTGSYKTSQGEPIGAPTSGVLPHRPFDLHGGTMARTMPHASDFPNQRPNYMDGRGLNPHIPGSLEQRTFTQPSNANMVRINGNVGFDSSSAIGLPVQDERFDSFPPGPKHRVSDQTEFEHDLKHFPRPSLDAETMPKFGSLSSRPFNRTVHDLNFDNGLNVDPAVGPVPSRFISSYNDGGSNDVGERPGGHHEDVFGRREPTRGHLDFYGPGPAHGWHHMDSLAMRSPGREQPGVSVHGFRGTSSDDIRGREVHRFGEPFRNSFRDSRLSMLPSHLRRSEFEGLGNIGMGNRLRHGLIGQGGFPNPLHRGEPMDKFHGASYFGEPDGIGTHPRHARIREMGPGSFDSFGGDDRSNHPHFGEPGFRSSFAFHGFPNDGDIYTGDLAIDKSRKRKPPSMGWCRICKVDCETVEGLDLHSQTREHQKMAMDMVLTIKQNAKKQKITYYTFPCPLLSALLVISPHLEMQASQRILNLRPWRKKLLYDGSSIGFTHSSLPVGGLCCMAYDEVRDGAFELYTLHSSKAYDLFKSDLSFFGEADNIEAESSGERFTSSSFVTCFLDVGWQKLDFRSSLLLSCVLNRLGLGKKVVAGIETSSKAINSHGESGRSGKPHFRPAKDDTKPVLQDPILRSDPIETEEAVLLLPPFPIVKENSKIGLRNH
ncbi:hypothetical protein F8388_002201 [Cannabis sativa]|uniref:RING-type domain-containing protein n=1 Tax=Cannabis sativa TaxID=3483 RepID=A0A7J6FU78_CANSA|nr:hypothetical protein F8388_002201 [Cannabis sativa]